MLLQLRYIGLTPNEASHAHREKCNTVNGSGLHFSGLLAGSAISDGTTDLKGESADAVCKNQPDVSG